MNSTRAGLSSIVALLALISWVVLDSWWLFAILGVSALVLFFSSFRNN